MSTLSPDSALLVASEYLRSISDWRSSAFGVCIYENHLDGWNAACELTAGAGFARAPVMQITSADGRSSTLVPRQSFFAAARNESELTVSADWFLDDVMDGYVTTSLGRKGNVSLERYEFGTLDTAQFQFLDALLSRFETLVGERSVAVLAIDISGEAAEQDWRNYFAVGGEPTAELLAVASVWRGRRPTHFPLLTRTTELEIYGRRPTMS